MDVGRNKNWTSEWTRPTGQELVPLTLSHVLVLLIVYICGITLSIMVFGLEIECQKKASKEQPIQRIRKIGTRLVRSDVHIITTVWTSHNDVRGRILYYNINVRKKHLSCLNGHMSNMCIYLYLCCHFHPGPGWHQIFFLKTYTENCIGMKINKKT